MNKKRLFDILLKEFNSTQISRIILISRRNRRNILRAHRSHRSHRNNKPHTESAEIF